MLSVIVAVALCALVLNRLGIPLDIAALGLLLGAGYHELDAG